MQQYQRSLAWCVGLVLSLLSSVARSADDVWPAAITINDVDLARSSISTQGEPAGEAPPLNKGTVQRFFQLNEPGDSQPELKLAKGWQLTLVFRRPIGIGTSVLSTGGESSSFTLQVLSPSFSGQALDANSADWEAISPFHTFVPGFQSSAVRLTATREYQGRLTWVIGKTRLTSLTSAAVGSGEQAPFGAHPNSIPLGKPWVNTDKDPRPGAPKQLQRGPISDVTPSWYLLSWDDAQSLNGLWLTSNVDEFRLLAYRGPEGLNPAIAPPSAWARVNFEVVHEQLGNGERLHDRLLTFAPLKTMALKLEITNCNRGPIASIGQMAALSTSAQTSRDVATPSFVGKPINYQQPFDGQVAMVITDSNGRTVRNLVAQVDRAKGANSEHWDLKDHRGLTVPPGKYYWKAITSPPLGLKYQLSVYPNAPQFFADRTPWLTGESGANGWLADHASITSGTVCGDRLYFGAPGVEAGVCLIECDLTGKKLWGKHSFAPFVGVGRLAGDERHVYIVERDQLHRLDPQTHQVERLTSLTSAERQGEVVGLAAQSGQVVVAMNAPVPWLENATRADIVDLEHCWPKFAERIADPLGTRRVKPSPRHDFLRLLRLAGSPAGQGQIQPGKRESIFPITIDTSGDGKHQYIVLAFKEPIPLGSLVLPCVGPEFLVDVSVLKKNAKYPPNPNRDEDWQRAAEKVRPGWTCVPMPQMVRTQGLRIRVRKAKDAGEDNLVDDLIAETTAKEKELDGVDVDKVGDGLNKGNTEQKESWFARFEGLKLLRRRFADVTPQAKIRVNSGEVNALGEWDAQRKSALSTQDPGIYVMEWPEATKLTGLAIKEIDGAVTQIDVWDESKGTGEIALNDAPAWRQVATYEQARRDSYEPAFERNDAARYLDGYVSFGGEVSTRAIRLRVVSQWADNGERGTASNRIDQGHRSLDPRRCRIAGVAALQYLGEESPLDSLAYQRLEIRDGQTGKLTRELHIPSGDARTSGTPTSLSFAKDGTLYGIQNGRVVQIDLTTGVAQNILPAVDGENQRAHRLAIGPNGSFHIFVLPEQVIRVYDHDGKLSRTLGHIGGQVPGPWDPEKFRQVETLLFDSHGQTWVVESQDVPRRIVQYAADGKFVREFYGNSHYGGGGILDPNDKSRVFYNHIEFAVDWKSGQSHIKNMLAEWMPEDCIPMQFGGATYLVRNPLSHQPTQSAAVIYRYNAAKGLAQLAAAFGEADAFNELKTPEVLSRLADGKVPKDYTFLWSDRSGNGRVDADEVTFALKQDPGSQLRLGRFNANLRCWAGKHYYQPKSNATAQHLEFEKVAPLNSIDASYELSNGELIKFLATAEQQTGGDGDAQETRGIDAKGNILWRYPTSYGGVSGLFLPPWSPGYVTNEFGVIGHGKSRRGDLGEFVIVHGNNGMWKIWTADGLLAGQILRHKFDPRSTIDSSQGTVKRDQAFDNLTAGQEHFHGYFTQANDGHDYIVHGFNYIGLWEVTGLDQFQRLDGDLVVTPEEVRQIGSQLEELARREAKSRARILECLPVKGEDLTEAAQLENTRFAIGYDAENLSLRWNVSGMGKLENSGVDFHRYFKTGACLDFRLGVDDKASPARKTPVAGDLRLLFTVAEGQPQAVLYQPHFPNAEPQDAWETRTDAGGITSFDRVVRLTDAKLDFKKAPMQPDSYTFTARIPLRELGWKPRDGQLLRCDWGVLTSDDGHTVKRRLYWSNTLATGTTDEAWEARLDPHLWGTMAVVTQSRSERQLDQFSPDTTRKPAAGADILDDLLNEPEPKKK